MKYTLSSFVAGLVFGLGLLLSGMANPEKVLGFLDLTGAWDPSLALVMAGAIIVGVIAFAIARQRHVSFLGFDMRLPSGDDISTRLIIGSVMFGIGWGLAGFCPGPGVVALGAGEPKAVVFVASMIAGMALFQVIEQRRQSA
ncbi:YeeE/YedE family protein [Marinobacter bryozoorum]|uniref:YeeE/YedE family protein n=1 Tax=Marinobacter bryozoorum TaxID=256324 RepID=UPI0020031A1E|nr:YeeE/YedE family protein [Marinobacter bryozoorum]MCK7543019.1 YeeE/YedE family protein [Marinobacter bryozoorum]